MFMFMFVCVCKLFPEIKYEIKKKNGKNFPESLAREWCIEKKELFGRQEETN